MKTTMKTTIGQSVDVFFPSVGASLTAKVDTGATMSCLHATDIKTVRNNVSFKCEQLSPHVITLPLKDMQTITTADGGDSSRPVVALHIKIGEVSLDDQLFNLNDRSDMDSPVLLGENVLEAGGFVIDLSVSESTKATGDDDRDASIVSLVKSLIKLDCSLSEFIGALKKEQSIG